VAERASLGARILLVEDDPTVASLLRDTLESDGYRVWHATTASEATFLAQEARPDLVILDLMLPDGSGLVLCTDLQLRTDAPIILCSGTKRKEDPVLGFKLGAADFVAKPFHLPELEARVEAALRGASARKAVGKQAVRAAPAHQRLGDLTVDRRTRGALLGGRDLRLTPTEFRLLELLVARAGTVVPAEPLIQAIWGVDGPGLRQSLAVHARRLRGKLRAGGPGGPVLVAVRGVGYRIAPPVTLPDGVGDGAPLAALAAVTTGAQMV
jgi:DNA-binding response OmpR family regulator